jgi:hypothetical protein
VYLGQDGRAVLVVSLDIAEGLVQTIRAVTIRRSFVTWVRGPVAAGWLIAELEVEVPSPAPAGPSGTGGDEGMSHGRVSPCLETRTPRTEEVAMKIFVAGTTGALGRRPVPLLVERGHEVVGTTRTPGKADALRAAGARPVVLDALDRDVVRKAVVQTEPEVVVGELTSRTPNRNATPKKTSASPAMSLKPNLMTPFP